MKKLARIPGLTASVLGLAVSLFGAQAPAQDKTVDLKISIWLPPAHPLVPASKEWADSITKASNGTIKSAIFPSEQLGKAFDHYDMARDGIADVTYVNPGYQPGRFPVIAVGQLPFTFADADKGTAALDQWYRKHAAQEMKDTHFCFAFIHDPGAYHGKKKVVAPEDIKGMKIRPAQSTIGQMVTMLGGTNVQASAPEARDVIERGVADAIFFPWGSMFLFGLDKVTKYHMDVPLYSTVFTYSMNKAKYDAMSPAQKKVIDDHCTTEWAVKVSSPWNKFEAAGRDKMKAAAGHEVYTLAPDQVTAWKTATQPLQKQWADAVAKGGGNAEALYKEFQESLAKNNAGF
jgi:TRAP-type C4-dicarboxylate transport system substrate-binding protein